MHISRLDIDQQDGTVESATANHERLKGEAGFRWAMLLRPLTDPTKLVSLSMWLQPAQAESAVPEASLYEVTTARGAMTPCAQVALTSWTIADANRADFTNVWNATFHHIEDKIGSRLMQRVGEPTSLVGLHAANDDASLNPEGLSYEVKVSDTVALRPNSLELFDVVLLTQA